MGLFFKAGDEAPYSDWPAPVGKSRQSIGSGSSFDERQTEKINPV